MSQRRVQLRIKGLVQGVSYRAYARDQALRLGLHGFVRNLRDGDVEAIAEGEPEAVEAFIRWCHTGPEEARVESVQASEQAPTGEYDSFKVER